MNAPTPLARPSDQQLVCRSLAWIAFAGALALSAIAQAEITSFTVAQSDTTSLSANLDLTAQGTLDWGLFVQGPGGAPDFDIADKPFESKAGGTGFTSIEEIGGASWNTAASYTLAFSERLYSWTDGTVTESGATDDDGLGLTAFGRVLTHNGSGTGFAGAGTRMTFEVAQAGTYQLNYYAATFNLALDASAELLSGGGPSTVSSPVTTGIDGSALDDYVFTVDFTTTGADTLVLDVFNSSTTAGGAYALEAFTLSGPTPATSLDLGNIWPLGDSITDGVDDFGSRLPGGYREPLYTNLIARGYDLTFVGSTDINPSTILTNAGQERHEGHSGFTIADIGSQSGLYERVAGWHASIPAPDIILLMIGINDLNHNSGVATAPQRLDDLITRLFTLEPDVRILVTTLPDADQDNPYRGGATNDIGAAVSDYNAAMLSMVASRRALGQEIELVDINAGLTLGDLDDGLHPNAGGYLKMADIWTDAIIATPPALTDAGVSAVSGSVSLEATGDLGTSYSLWSSENLEDWTLLRYDSIRANPFTIEDTTSAGRRFYRFSAP